MKIQLAPFDKGVVAATRVTEAHRDLDFPDHHARTAAFWYYCGALATGEFDLSSQDDLSQFLLGCAVRAPQKGDVEVLFHTDSADFVDTDEHMAIAGQLRAVARLIGEGHSKGDVTDSKGEVIGEFTCRDVL